MSPEQIAQIVNAAGRGGELTQDQLVSAATAVVEKWDATVKAIWNELFPHKLWDVPEIVVPLLPEMALPWPIDDSPGTRALKTASAVEAGYAVEAAIVARGIPGPIRLASKAFASAALRAASLTPKQLQTTLKVAKGAWDGAKLAAGWTIAKNDAALLIEALLDKASAAAIKARMDDIWAPAAVGIDAVVSKLFPQGKARVWKKARTRAEPEGEGFAKAVKRGRERVKRGGTARKGRGQSK